MGYETIKEGQQALIFNEQGQGRLVVGPRRVSHVRFVCLLFVACI